MPTGFAEVSRAMDEVLRELVENATLGPRYSARWRWGFWQVVKETGFVDIREVVYWHPRKAPVTAYLVRLSLEGKRVQL